MSACTPPGPTEQCLGSRVALFLALPDGGAWVAPDGGFDGGASLAQALEASLSGTQCRPSNVPGRIDCRRAGADCQTSPLQAAEVEAGVRQQLQVLAPELLSPGNPKTDPCACRAWVE